MRVWSDRTIRRIMMLLDILSMAAAFVLGLLIRYRGDLREWQLQIYYSFLIYNFLVYLFLLISRLLRVGDYDLLSCDWLDLAVHVVRDRFLQYVVVILLLTLSHNFQRISRLALLYMVLLDVLIAFVLRLILRSLILVGRSDPVQVRTHYVIVTTEAERSIACRRLSEVLPWQADCMGVILVDPGDEREMLHVLERTMQPEEAVFPDPADGRIKEPESTENINISVKNSSYTAYYKIECSEDCRMAGRFGQASAANDLQNDGRDLPLLEHLPEGARVFVYLGGTANASAADLIVRFYRQHGIPVYARLFAQGRELPQSMIQTDSMYVSAQFEPIEKCADVLGVQYAPADVERAAFEVLGAILGEDSWHFADDSESEGESDRKHSAYDELPSARRAAGSAAQETTSSAAGAAGFTAQNRASSVAGVAESAAQEEMAHAAVFTAGCTPHGTASEYEDTGTQKPAAAQGTAGVLSGEYICFSNVHTTVMAYEDVSYREVLNGSAFTFPDGTPIARQLRGMGYEDCMRVAGPDFMDAVFRATMDGKVGHYFYGSTQETIDKLCEELPKRYPGIRIAGAVSPPFRPETEEEDAASVAAMNESGAALIWIGLGAPKQEKWMAAHRGRVNGVMLGVGAGFNFFAGTVRRAPKWVQKLGLEWLYRLFQDPKRLANRYIITNAKYVWYIITGAGKRRRE